MARTTYKREGVGSLHVDDMWTVMQQLPDESVNAIITDPPYSKKALPLFRDLLELSGRVLAPNGHLITFLPAYALPTIFSYPTPGLQYRWLITMLQPGQQARLVNAKRTVAVSTKPLGWWTKHPWGEPDYDLVVDSFVSPSRVKGHHPWEQNVAWADYCVGTFTKPGQVVLDPFMGSGTLALTCIRAKRRFICVEIDPATASAAWTRIEEEIRDVRRRQARINQRELDAGL